VKKKGKYVIGIDLGGTKVAAALVTPAGKILAEQKAPTHLKDGWPGLKRQLLELCRGLQSAKYKAAAVGVGSAGPLHSPSGKLLDPTNFGWKAAPVSLARELSQALKVPVHLENDAAAAVLAERWKGGARKNSAVLTLGTGLGLGVVCDGELVRGGRGLHPEGGHVLLRPGDPSAPCGCGNFGCAEAYLAGARFTERAAVLIGERDVTGERLVARAAAGDVKVKALFADYSELMAAYLQDLVVLYYPEEVIFTGSFAAALPHFLPATALRLKELLLRRLKTIPLLPKLRVSRLGNRAGVLGSAFLALSR
jgi:glucokinase